MKDHLTSAVDIRVRVDNDDIRVTEFRLLPGAQLARRHHTCDVVSLFLTEGRLRDLELDNVRLASPGEIVASKAPGATCIVNVGEEPVEFVEIDLKWTERRLISG